MCHGQARRVLLGMGDLPPLIGILIMGPYKPPRTWVDEFIPYYMEMSWESWELIDPIAHIYIYIYDTWMLWLLLIFFIVFTVYPRRLPASFWNRSGSSMLALLDARLSSVSGTF